MEPMAWADVMTVTVTAAGPSVSITLVQAVALQPALLPLMPRNAC